MDLGDGRARGSAEPPDPRVRRGPRRTMIVGVPREIKPGEARVALTPPGARALAEAGHRVVVERGAGGGSGIRDDEYAAVGAALAAADEVWQRAELVLKVKEPLPAESARLRPGQILFTYLHLAPAPELARALRDSGAIAIAYETVQRADGSLPLLTPMSEVAGRLAVQEGAFYLGRPHGGRGILLSGVPGVPPGNVVILGAGTAGLNAARTAVGLGADVSTLDVNPDRLRHVDDIFRGQVVTLMSNSFNVEQVLRRADLLIGAVLVAGSRTPRSRRRSVPRPRRSTRAFADVPRRDLRVQLRRVEGHVLSLRPAGVEDARLVRRALPDGGDQRDVLPDAQRADPRRVARHGARRLHLRPEGAAANHARGPPPRRGRAAPVLLRHRPDARRQARPPPLPAPAQLQKGDRPARRPPRAAPAGAPGGPRVPSRELVRRRDLRPAPRAKRRPLRRRYRGRHDAHRRDGGLGLRAAARGRVRRRRSERLDRDAPPGRRRLARGGRLLQARGVGVGPRPGPPARRPTRATGGGPLASPGTPRARASAACRAGG